MTRIDIDPDRWMDHPRLAARMHGQLANEGILLASLAPDGKLNPMTIGWAVFGWIWGRPVYTVLVRPSRYTHACIEATGDFTINAQPADRQDIANYCGTASGRDCDKLKDLDLSILESSHIASPGIAECPLVFECRVVHKIDMVPGQVPRDIASHYYKSGDWHRVYFGQIMGITAERGFVNNHK